MKSSKDSRTGKVIALYVATLIILGVYTHNHIAGASSNNRQMEQSDLNNRVEQTQENNVSKNTANNVNTTNSSNETDDNDNQNDTTDNTNNSDAIEEESPDTNEENTTDSAVAEELETPVSLSCSNNSVVLNFTADEEGKWRWNDDPDFPLDNTIVQSIIDAVSHVQDRVAAISTDEAFLYGGFDDHDISATVTFDNGSSQTVTLGNAIPNTSENNEGDGNDYLARLNREQNITYIVNNQLYKQLTMSIYDMCILPALPRISESNIQTIVIKGAAGGTVTFLNAQRKSDGSVSWRTSDNEDVTDSPLIRSLIEDLEAPLAFSRCVDYSPTEEAVALCGLDSPAGTLTVTYQNEDGTSDTLEMFFGLRLADESGRYARLGTEEPIYFIPARLINPTMPIAIFGLDALL